MGTVPVRSLVEGIEKRDQGRETLNIVFIQIRETSLEFSKIKENLMV